MAFEDLVYYKKIDRAFSEGTGDSLMLILNGSVRSVLTIIGTERRELKLM